LKKSIFVIFVVIVLIVGLFFAVKYGNQKKKETQIQELAIPKVFSAQVKMIYDAGREPSVKDFIQEAGLMKYIDQIEGSRKNYILFTRYMEALVAYRKFVAPDKDL